MKRGKPLARKAALGSGSKPLTRRTELSRGNGQPARSKPLKASGRKRAAKVSPENRARALERSRGRCVCCGARAVQVHHVLPRQSWPEMADKVANLVGVCVRCHERHELAVTRIPRRVLPPETLKLARRTGLLWYIERTYPLDAGRPGRYPGTDEGTPHE